MTRDEEETYREGVKERMFNFEQDVRNSLQRLEVKQDLIDTKVTYTNGKVRKIIIALAVVAGITIGQALSGKEIIMSLLHTL